jgi:serine/threonine protein phosphatase 1
MCIGFLNNVKNLVKLRGNHDHWAYQHLGHTIGRLREGLYFDEFRSWVNQGGQATINSLDTDEKVEEAFRFIDSSKFYHKDVHRLFVHGGIKLGSKAEDNEPNDMMWDRRLVLNSILEQHSGDYLVPYDEVFAGHTPTILLSVPHESTIPIHVLNVWMVDTGASYSGCLTVMDVDTKEFWQSDPVVELYPGIKAR